MRWLEAIVTEIFGLFVDDGSLALAIIGWLVFVGLVLPRLSVTAPWGGMILFTGLALILVESAIRGSRR
jgi:hypothetical protein